MQGNIVWKTEKRKLSELKPAAYNPRKISKKQKQDLTNSLDKFNLADPIIINTDNTIIGGHQRYFILKDKKQDIEIDVRVPTQKLDEKQEKELNVRLNKNIGEFDIDILSGFNEDFLKDIGFESSELDNIFKEKLSPEDDDVPEIEKTNIKIGDIFNLGEHRLLCGDCTNREDVFKFMNGEKADIVFTDPPYGVSYSDKNTFLNSIDAGNCIQKEINNDNVSEDKICEFWLKSFEIIRDILAPVNSYYIFGPQIQGMMMMMMMMKAKLPYKHVIIWVKNNHVLGRCDYNYRHEPIFFGWTKTHNFTRQGEFLSSVWEVDKPHKSDLHPTMKPIALAVNALLNSSERDQICFDGFGGSGTALIACEKTKRKCRMIEIDPLYCQVIINRWENITNLKAVKINN